MRGIVLLLGASSVSLSTMGQSAITAPMPDTDDINVRFKLIQTIVVDAGNGGGAHFAETGAQLYTETYVYDEQDCRPCQGIQLRNVVSGNVIKTTDNLIISSYSNNAGLAVGEDVKRGLFGPSYKSSFYTIHGGAFTPLFRVRQDSRGKFSGDNRYYATFGFDGTPGSAIYLKIALYDVQRKKQTAEVAANDNISFIGFSDDSQHLLAACEDGTVRIWSAASAALLHSFDIGAGKVEWAAELSNQGVILAAAESLVKLDSKSGKVIQSIPWSYGLERSSHAISSDGKLLARWNVLNEKSVQINIYSTETLTLLSTIWDDAAERSNGRWELETGEMSFSADNKAFLASGNANDRLPIVSLVRIWRIERGL